MAKLRARGRTEIFRMVRQEPPDAEGVERKTVYAFMSDGIVLYSQTTRIPTRSYNGYTIPAHTNRTGWKVSKQNKAQTQQEIEESLRLKGFVRGAL